MPSHTLQKHNYTTRANLIPPMSPITPPIRPRPSPPVYDHPYSLGMEWGREDEIEELDLGKRRIPLEHATTHVVVRRGGETVVFSWEEWWEYDDGSRKPRVDAAEQEWRRQRQQDSGRTERERKSHGRRQRTGEEKMATYQLDYMIRKVYCLRRYFRDRKYKKRNMTMESCEGKVAVPSASRSQVGLLPSAGVENCAPGQKPVPAQEKFVPEFDPGAEEGSAR